MRKLLLLGLWPGLAFSQSGVTMYGAMDLGVVYEWGGPAATGWNVQSGVQAGSRLGFRGAEELGGGYSAMFVIESGIAGDTGANRPTGVAYGRQTLVGLAGPAGTLKLGRQFNLLTYALNDIDPFEGGHEGAYSNIMFSDYRTNNGVYYTSPALSGVTLGLAYGAGEVAGSTRGRRELGYAVQYNRGPLFAVLAHRSLNNLAATSTQRVTFGGATWDFGPFKGALGYAVNRDGALLDSSDVLVGASSVRGADTFMVSWIRHRDRSRLRQHASQAALGYMHALSKRTDFYSSYSRVNNDNGAPFTAGNAIETGSGTRGLAAGMFHKF
jgi:predicted porin